MHIPVTLSGGVAADAHRRDLAPQSVVSQVSHQVRGQALVDLRGPCNSRGVAMRVEPEQSLDGVLPLGSVLFCGPRHGIQKLVHRAGSEITRLKESLGHLFRRRG